MNFYASRPYLDTLACVYFGGKSTRITDFEVNDRYFRFLVVGGKQIITNWSFLDYHEPIAQAEAQSPTRRDLYVSSCCLSSVTVEEWEKSNLAEVAKPVPYVDFSGFKSYSQYREFIAPRAKDRFKKNRRLRERLAEDFGELKFTLHDTASDVFDSSFAWKSQQLRETGLNDVFSKPENWEFFRELERRGALRATTLRAKDRLLSSWIGFVHEGVWSGWIFTFDHDPALKKYSLGWQLMESLLENCYESGLKGFDFSVGGSDYKFAYGTHVRLLQPFGTKAFSVRVTDRLKSEAKTRFPKLYDGAREIARAAKHRL